MMAFTPGDVFVGSILSPPALYEITGGGDFSAASPVANLGSQTFGQIAWSRDLNTAYIALFDNSSVVAVNSAGVVTPFATGLSGPTGLILTNDDRLLVSELTSGEVTDITVGGDFTSATPYASGLNNPRNMVQVPGGQILVGEDGSGEVTDLATGGDLSGATPFAAGLGSVTDIAQSSSGALYVSDRLGLRVLNISSGGNFTGSTPFATGLFFGGLTFDGAGRLLAAAINTPRIYDISAGGDFSGATPFANLPSGVNLDSLLDTVPANTPGTLTPALSGGNLVITDTDATGKNNAFSVSNNGAGSIVITDAVEKFASTGGIAGAVLSDGNKTLTVPVASIAGTQIIINGMAGNDTLTANVATALGKILTFNGGTPTVGPGDKLIVTGGSFATGTLNHTNASDGSVVLGPNTINYTGLEPVDVTGSTFTALIINLPDNAATGDDTELSFDGANLAVTSLNATHESDLIAVAGLASVTVNARAGDDTIRLDATMATFNKALVLNGDAGADKFVFESGIAAPGTITVNGGAGGATLDYSGFKVAAVDTAVDINLTATAANGFTGTVKVGATTVASFTAISGATGNSATTTDSLTGLNATSAWTIDEPANSKYVSTGTFNFTKFEKLNGGSGSDGFVVTNPSATAMTLAGGGGTNSLNLSAVANANVTLTNVDAAGADGIETTKSITFSDIKTLTGDGASSLTGTNSASTWVIDDGAANTYATDLTFSGFKTLTGGNGIDTFNVRNNSGAIAYSLNGGAGVDAFNFGNANSLAAISKNISVDGGADGATLTLNDQALATNINYSAGANTIGRDGSGIVSYSNVTNLTLNATNGTNTIKLTAVPAATGTKTFNGGTGDDTLDTAGIANNVIVTAPNATKGFDGTINGAGSFTGIEFFKGNNASTFVGDDEIATWTVNDSGTNTYISQSRTANISGFSTLQGGSKVDTFNVLDNSGTLAYTLKGGASLDAFNFGNANSLAAISKNITVDGETDSATLTLNDQAVATNINYTLGANTIGRDTGGAVTYSAVSNLTLNASNGSNNIKITAAPTATGTKLINGGTGNDVLDLSALAASKVTLTGLTVAPASTGFDGNVDSVASFTGVEEIKGSTAGATDELIGLNAAATWTINDATGNSYATTRTLKWSAFENLTGNAGIDTYKVQNNATSNTLTLDGKAGGDKFLIGDTVNKLAGLKNLNVIGGADAGDELTLNDQAEAGASNYNFTATDVTKVGGVAVSHNTVEKITLNASAGANAITVFDGAYNPATTIKLVDTTGASTLAVDDTADVANNTWTMSAAQVVRTAPTPTLTIDYSSQATITNLSLAGGSAVDNVTVSGTKIATSVSGNDGNDVFTVGGGDLDNFLGQLTINGGTHNLADTRTVFKGGATPGPADIVFNASSSSVAKGDTLTVNDAVQTGVTKYAVNNTTVSRTGAAKSVTYSSIELLNVLAGSGDSDVVINLPTAAPDLPFVVSVDGGNAAADNRVQIKGTDAADAITIGNGTAVETNRSQFEVTSVTRLWVEGGKNADVIHNRSTVPGLLDGGYAKSSAAIDPGNQDDVIASDAPSTTAFSPVLLGGDGLDFLYTTNGSAAGTTYLVGDYFVNNNVPLTSGSATKTSRLQIVGGTGQAGDRYVTNHTPAVNLRNRVLARLDTAANSYSGRFANLTADTIGSTLGVIEWLRGRLPLTVTAAGMAGELSKINQQIRLFTREPGSAAAPAFPNASYNPGGVSSGGSASGGEYIEEEEAVEPTTLVQNPFDAGDVNGDGRITAFDAIIIINDLNLHGARKLDNGGSTNEPLDFLDVNGDSSVSAFDAIIVINRLNSEGSSTYALPNPLDWFIAADAAEQAAADFAASLPADLPNSLSDDALLALLATYGDADDSE